MQPVVHSTMPAGLHTPNSLKREEAQEQRKFIRTIRRRAGNKPLTNELTKCVFRLRDEARIDALVTHRGKSSLLSLEVVVNHLQRKLVTMFLASFIDGMLNFN